MKINPRRIPTYLRNVTCGFVMLVAFGITWAQQPSQPQNSEELQRILSRLDQTAAEFHTAQASFVWDQYERVVNGHDLQKGTVYFRRVANEVQMAADITDPQPPKYVLYTDSRVQVYYTKANEVDTYNTGKDRATIESFLVLGFGGSGKDMLNSFDVKYMGRDKIDGNETVKLELVPKSDKVRNTFDHIWLWIDPSLGVSVQQQFFEPQSGDYRLAKYQNIKLNQRIPDPVFKLKTTPKTKVVPH
jgi:outer membrane lipoprotein-sorting protein